MSCVQDFCISSVSVIYILLGMSRTLFSSIYTFQWLPESARYYLASGQHAKAQAMLDRVARENGSQLPPGHLNTLDDAVSGIFYGHFHFCH